MDPIDYNKVRRVSFTVSAILTEKIARHVELFFSEGTTRRKIQTESLTVVWTYSDKIHKIQICQR